MGHARKERVLLVGTRSADHIRASGHSGRIQRPHTWLHPNVSLRGQIFPLHRRRRPYMGPISKQGDRYVRRILVIGAVSMLRRAKLNPERYPWVTRLLARRPFKVVAIALANKMARVAWALLAKGGTYRPRLAAA